MILGYCDNCSEIIIDEIERRNKETLHKNVGDDIIIKANTQICSETSITLRFNHSTRGAPKNCEVYHNFSTYKCSNLTTNNTGVYALHVGLQLGSSKPEWCTNNVTIIVQCKVAISCS